MRLNAEEKEICKQYSKRKSDGLVGCPDCPLVINKRYCVCKRNVNKDEYEEWKEQK